MRRIPWDILLALLFGFGLGLTYSWVISPTRVIDSEPAALRADFKDHYRSAIAASYASTGNLPRARARLSLLGDAEPIEALNAQAQRMLASGQSLEGADQAAALASALGQNSIVSETSTPTIETINDTASASTSTFPPPPSDMPIQTTETQQPVETQPAVSTATPRPTRTFIPTPGEPFTLTGQETVCDTNLPDGLLQVLILNSNRRQMPGIEILITWDGGEENFFTGLKPELGNGYADYSMTPDIIYAVQLKLGSDIASGLTAPACQTSSGEAFFGGIKLTFQQPQ